jgi:tetratricopeptide (TPR) repeat protein
MKRAFLIALIGLTSACSAFAQMSLSRTGPPDPVNVRDPSLVHGGKASYYDSYGFNLVEKGDYEGAKRCFTEAIRIDPYRWSAYYNRSLMYARQKNWAAALQDLNSTIHNKPSFFPASFARARINERLGNYNDSLRDLDIMVNLSARVGNYEEHAMALNNRAWIRAVSPDASVRNGQLAVADAKKACELTKWKVANCVGTLAAAHAEIGDFDSAIRYQEQAITLKKAEPEETSKKMAKYHLKKERAEKISIEMAKEAKASGPGYAQRLELYKAHRPYRGT